MESCQTTTKRSMKKRHECAFAYSSTAHLRAAVGGHFLVAAIGKCSFCKSVKNEKFFSKFGNFLPGNFILKIQEDHFQNTAGVQWMSAESHVFLNKHRHRCGAICSLSGTL